MGPEFQGPALCITSQPFQAQQASLGSQHAGKYSSNAAGKGILIRDGVFHLFPSPPQSFPSHPWQGMLIMFKELIASTLP